MNTKIIILKTNYAFVVTVYRDRIHHGTSHIFRHFLNICLKKFKLIISLFVFMKHRPLLANKNKFSIDNTKMMIGTVKIAYRSISRKSVIEHGIVLTYIDPR